MRVLTSYSNSAIRGTHCGLCAKLFEPEQPAYRTIVPHQALCPGLHITGIGPVCESCAREHGGFFGNYKHIGGCLSCGRQVFTQWPHAARRGVHCCERCRQQYRRKKEITYCTCAHCAEPFIQKRSDAKYCSAKCRQTAYRNRSTTDNDSTTQAQ